MKNTLTVLVFALAVVFADGCRRTDVRDFSVSIPDLTTEDAPAISAALAPYAGIDRASLKFDPSAKTLTLRYDSMQLAKKNVNVKFATQKIQELLLN